MDAPFRLGEYVVNKKSGISYRINGFGRNRATGEHYYVLDNNSILKESEWNNYKAILLTWEDMMLLENIFDKMIEEDISGEIPKTWTNKDYYEEILKRFKEARYESL